MIEATTLAYLAGIIDGEGSIGYYANGIKGAVLTIEVKMSEKEVVALFAEIFGGTIWIRPPKGVSRKTQYRWRVRGAKAEKVFRQLAPYLRIKRV